MSESLGKLNDNQGALELNDNQGTRQHQGRSMRNVNLIMPPLVLQGAELVAGCEKCWDMQAAAKCSNPRFCSEIVGIPWCDGSGKADTSCDNNANGVNISRGCCQKYVDHTIAHRCGGLPCPAYQAMDATVSSCKACFAEAAGINCTTPTSTNGYYTGPSFCTSTQFGSLPWCGPRQRNLHHYSSAAQFCSGTFITTAMDCSKLTSGKAQTIV